MRPLTVYGWGGRRREAPEPHYQTREIVAAPSMAAAARAAGDKRPAQMLDLCKTGNKRELEVALAEPGVVFWRGLDDYHGPFTRAEKKAERSCAKPDDPTGPMSIPDEVAEAHRLLKLGHRDYGCRERCNYCALVALVEKMAGERDEANERDKGSRALLARSDAEFEKVMNERDAAIREGDRKDDPEMDATDYAHPAWWRGNDAGVASCARIVVRLCGGEDDGGGVSREPWEGARRAIVALRHGLLPHMCKNGHGEIRYRELGTDERCPVCLTSDALYMAQGAQRNAEGLLAEVLRQAQIASDMLGDLYDKHREPRP